MKINCSVNSSCQSIFSIFCFGEVVNSNDVYENMFIEKGTLDTSLHMYIYTLCHRNIPTQIYTLGKYLRNQIMKEETLGKIRREKTLDRT